MLTTGTVVLVEIAFRSSFSVSCSTWNGTTCALQLCNLWNKLSNICSSTDWNQVGTLGEHFNGVLFFFPFWDILMKPRKICKNVNK